MSHRSRRPDRNHGDLLRFCALLLVVVLSPAVAYADGSDTPSQDAQPAVAVAQADSAPPAGDAQPAADAKPADNAPPADAAKPVDAEKPAEDAKPAEAEKEAEKAKPVDVDFAIQGEFVGMVSTSPSKLQQIALQVRAAGKGSFEAAQYMGGLPGSGQLLQIKALGDGGFEAVKLPDSAAKQERVQLLGQRNDDFLVLSGGQWAVLVQADQCLLIDHDGNRVGRLERVHRQSPTLGAKPPEGAVVLFDGSNADQFDNARITEDGLLMEGADMKPLFQDFNLHLEFLLPFTPAGRDQGRGNSGVYLLSRYEVQVLDSFALEPVDNGCGGLYQFRAPDVNMCFPPQVWQTYDIVFTAPRWAADGTKLKNARITLWQNGTKIHDDVELPHKTGAGSPEDSTLLPTRLQNHSDPVRFQNIWLIDRGAAPPTGFPVFSEDTTK